MNPGAHEGQVVSASYNNKTPAFYPRNINSKSSKQASTKET